MKVAIVAAVSLDGKIAKSHHDGKIDWTSEADKQWMHEITQRSGYVIMGHNTFDTLTEPLKDRVNIVMTHHPEKQISHPRTEFTNESPQVILDNLKNRGCQEVVVFGGEEIFALFLQAKLVDVMWLTIAPVILGKGINFPYQSVEGETKLASFRYLGEGEILLELMIN